MRKLLSSLYENAAARPTHPALLFVKRQRYVQLSFSDLLAETVRWAAHFTKLGLERGAVVAIVLDHRLELYTAFLGAMRAGLVPTFLPYPTPKQAEAFYWQSQDELFARLRPACTVTYGALRERIESLTAAFQCAIVDVDDTFEADSNALPALHEVETGESVALLQHSSGTTGSKKGVALTYAAIAAQTEAHTQALGATFRDRVVSWLPLYHDMGLFASFLFPVAVGSSIVSFDAFEWLLRPAMFFELIERYRATHAWLPNFALAHLVRTHDPEATYDLSSLRALVSSSEPCKPATFDAFRETFSRHGLAPGALRCSYAMAETVFACTLTATGTAPVTIAIDAQELALRNVATAPVDRGVDYLSCGRPLDGLGVRIAAAGGANVGEIQLRGRFVFDGYYRNEAATAEAFDDGWYRTGDVGFLYEGELFVCGRIKEMLVVHGQNYYANDIEEIVSAVPGVKPGRTVAFGRFDESTASEEAVVLAESEAASGLERAELTRAIRTAVYGSLGLQIRHVDIRAIGELVKTTSGKISRSENQPMFERAETGSPT